MIRKILFLGALGAAGLALTACGPSSGILANAKTGDCFNVTGKDAMGQPKLIHADCPAGQTSGQSTLPPADQTAAAGADTKVASASPPPATPANAAPAKPDAKAVCQPVAPACVVPAKAHAVSAPAYHAKAGRYAAHALATRYTHALNTHRVWRTRHVIRHRHGQAYTETVTEYVPASGEITATIGAPYNSTTELAGGSRREDTYVLREHPVYAPPAYGPPPPPADAHRYERHDDRRAYDSRSYDSRSYSSQSYSSQSYGSGQHTAPPPPRPCNCTTQRAPVYEPDGYLTWPNKSQY